MITAQSWENIALLTPIMQNKKEFQVTVTGIKTGKKRERTAFAYILDENRPSGVPSMSYVMTCLWGYRNFGFDSKQLLHAIDESKKETMI